MSIIRKRGKWIICIIGTIIYGIYNVIQTLIAIIMAGVSPVSTKDIVLSISLILLVLIDKIFWYKVLKDRVELIVISILTYIITVTVCWSYLITL